MIKKEEKITRVVSHKSCADGIASALILRAACPEAKIEFMRYNSPELDQLPVDDGSGGKTIFCDITPPKNRAQAFADAGHYCLDHHKSARDIVALFEERGRFADEKDEPGVSGAWLAFEVLESRWPGTVVGDRAKEFASLAGIYDTWQRDHPLWQRASAQAQYLFWLGEKEAMEREVSQPYLTVEEERFAKLMQERQLQRATEAYENRLCYMDGYAILADNHDGRLINEVADIAREREDRIKAVIGYVITPNQSTGEMRYKFSLRRVSPDFDCASKAEEHGGGGHSGAGGFDVTVRGLGSSPLRWLYDEFLGA